MKKAVIIHGWGGSSREPMHKWMKSEMEKKGYEVISPDMPNTEKPEINSWVSKLKSVIGKVDRETILIGHSIGCQTIMRYLEKTNFKDKVEVIFIAGWFKLDNLDGEEEEKIARPWLETNINFSKIKEKISRLIVFLSDNEPYNFVDYNAKIFKEKLNANVIILKRRGHFSEDTGVKDLPEILQFIR